MFLTIACGIKYVDYPGLCRQAVIGLLLVKELVLIDMFSNIPVSALSMRPIPQLRADTAMYDLLKLFQTGRTHMVLLTQPPPGARLLGAHVAGSSGTVHQLQRNHTIKQHQYQLQGI